MNANTGEIAWQTTLGINEALPEGKLRRRQGNAGPILTRCMEAQLVSKEVQVPYNRQNRRLKRF